MRNMSIIFFNHSIETTNYMHLVKTSKPNLQIIKKVLAWKMEFCIRQNMHIQMYASEYPQGYYAMEFHLMILKHFVLIWMLRWSAI